MGSVDLDQVYRQQCPAPDDTIEWLLGGDPSIRWQTRRDLLDAADDEFEADRALVATSGWGKRLLDLQDPPGTWAGGLYGPKWTSTTYTLLLLRHCGLPQDDPQARRGVERLWEGARYFDGGLTAAVTIDAPEACITSIYIALARYFGYRHPRVDGAEEWLLAQQLADGGWNCRNVRFGDRHGSFHTSILALEALAEIDHVEPHRSDIAGAVGRGRAFFLDHRLYRSHRTGDVVDPAFTRLSFPPRWHYDILRGLDHFATTGAPWDDRYGDALEALTRRQRSDGTWPLQHRHAGKVWFDMEQSGGPSRWNTLRALRVLRWAAQSPGHDAPSQAVGSAPPSSSDHPATWKFGYPIYHAETRAQWRAWLEANHDTAPGVWLCSWRTPTRRPTCPYPDVVEEAICFGWIDSTVNRLDEDRGLQLLTPRKPKSTWTRLNRQRVADMETAGLMTDAGRGAVEAAKLTGWWTILDPVEDLIEPDDLADALDANPPARLTWDEFPPSTRKAMLWWVISAAKDPTRARRIAAIVAKAACGERAQG